jgi:signal transduction histidine kinase/CheY-like chemotaxis protein
MRQKETAMENRIDEFIEVLMNVAQGDYTAQVNMTGENDYWDALAVGINTMVDDLKISQEVKRENKKIKKLNVKLRKAKALAEENNRLKSAFISNLSHEIRTPMNGIIGFANLLNEPDITPEKYQNFVRIIINSSNQLLRIIDDILEISKLETKQIKVIEQEVNINDLMLELFNVFNLRTKEIKIPLYLKKTLQDEASIVLTDKSKLSKILSNLLENAMKFTSEGCIEFGYKMEDNNLVFFVTDTGVGISADKQEKIFERFAQVENRLSGNVSGLGLGLSIAKENAELLGGNIRLESEEGKGSAFFVSIPYHPVYTNTNNTDLGDNIQQAGNTILVAEDEEINLLYLETLLSRYNGNLNILHATTGAEAVNLCKQEKSIELVLMDIKMPVLNGIEAAKIIRELYPDMPIVAQSAYTAQADIEFALQNGFDEYITKPINKNILFETLSKYLVKK